MSDLPDGWARVALEDLIEPRSDRVSPKELPDAQFIGMEHVEPHTNRIIETVPASTMVSNAARFFAGDVLYGRMRPYLNKVAAPSFDGLASAEFIVFPKLDAIDEHFLLRRLSASDFTEFACSQYEGDRPRVKFDKLGKFDLHLPPRAEQTRIVEKLEELLSDLDAGVAELKAAQRKLAQYRQSLLKAAVEGALTADWRAARAQSGEPQETGAALLQRILTERRTRWETKQLAKFAEQGKAPPKDWKTKYPEPFAPDITALPSLPEGWTWATIDQLSPDDLANGRSVPTADVGAKVLRLTAVKHGRIDLSEYKIGAWSSEEARPFAVCDGDLLIVRGNGSLSLVGRLGLVRGVAEQVAYPDTLIRLRLTESVVMPEWVMKNWDSRISRTHLERRARTSAGIYKISQPDIVSVSVPIPPMSEQARILSLLEHGDEQLGSLNATLDAGLKQSAAQRKNILKAAFAGQLVPQDPNDEPACALLERIRTTKMEHAGKAKPVAKRGRKT